MSQQTAGIFVAILGSFINSVGLLTQKWAHARNAELPPAERTSCYVVGGYLIYVVGNLCDVTALSMTAQTTVSGLSPLVLVGNILFAPAIIGERPLPSHLAATLVVISGSVLMTVFGPGSPVAPQPQGCSRVDFMPPSCFNASECTLPDFGDKTAELSAPCLMDLFRLPTFVFYAACTIPFLLVNALLVKQTEAQYMVPETSSYGVVTQPAAAVAAEEAEKRDGSDGAGPGVAKVKAKKAKVKMLSPQAAWKAASAEEKLVIDPICYDLSTVRGLWIGISYALTTAYLSSFNIVFSKIVGTLVGLSLGGENQFGPPFSGIAFVLCLVFCNVNQILLLTMSLKKFPALFIVPCYQVFFMLLSIAVGGIYFREFWLMGGASQWAVFLAGVTLGLLGVLVLARGDVETSEEISNAQLKFQIGLMTIIAIVRLQRRVKKRIAARGLEEGEEVMPVAAKGTDACGSSGGSGASLGGAARLAASEPRPAVPAKGAMSAGGDGSEGRFTLARGISAALRETSKAQKKVPLSAAQRQLDSPLRFTYGMHAIAMPSAVQRGAKRRSSFGGGGSVSKSGGGAAGVHGGGTDAALNTSVPFRFAAKPSDAAPAQLVLSHRLQKNASFSKKVIL